MDRRQGLAAETRRRLQRLDQRGDQAVRAYTARKRAPAARGSPAALAERFVTLGRDG